MVRSPSIVRRMRRMKRCVRFHFLAIGCVAPQPLVAAFVIHRVVNLLHISNSMPLFYHYPCCASAWLL